MTGVQSLPREREARGVHAATPRYRSPYRRGGLGEDGEEAGGFGGAGGEGGAVLAGVEAGAQRGRHRVGVEEADARADAGGLGGPGADQRLGGGLGGAVGAEEGLAGAVVGDVDEAAGGGGDEQRLQHDDRGARCRGG